MRIVRPFRSLSVARAWARVDSGLDKAKISSDRRVDADRPRLRAVFRGGKTFLHGLGHQRKSPTLFDTSSARPSNVAGISMPSALVAPTSLMVPFFIRIVGPDLLPPRTTPSGDLPDQ